MSVRFVWMRRDLRYKGIRISEGKSLHNIKRQILYILPQKNFN